MRRVLAAATFIVTAGPAYPQSEPLSYIGIQLGVHLAEFRKIKAKGATLACTNDKAFRGELGRSVIENLSLHIRNLGGQTCAFFYRDGYVLNPSGPNFGDRKPMITVFTFVPSAPGMPLQLARITIIDGLSMLRYYRDLLIRRWGQPISGSGDSIKWHIAPGTITLDSLLNGRDLAVTYSHDGLEKVITDAFDAMRAEDAKKI